ncbi:MAG: hypothetical protein M5U34_28685 [Chloroflexi bacterium]|nr:hypothetical protein [Chloroflexota bacterium]
MGFLIFVREKVQTASYYVYDQAKFIKSGDGSDGSDQLSAGKSVIYDGPDGGDGGNGGGVIFL